MKYKNIVVTGGSGLLGKSLQEIMPDATYLSSKNFDLRTREGVEGMLLRHTPDCIINCSAVCGGILINSTAQATYFTDNILMNTLITEYSYRYGIKRFISMLSTCIYPDKMDKYPMTELDYDSGPPTSSNYAYAVAKRAHATQIHAYNQQYGTKYQYLIPCNLYGAHDKFGSNSHYVSSLIKKIHVSKTDGCDKIVLFGTGKPLRQFMHSDDLARVIKYCIDNDVYENMNVAPEENLSIDEMARIALKAMKAEDLTIQYDNSQLDGQFRKDVASHKMLYFIPDFKFTPLAEGIKKTYEQLLKNKTFEL